MTGRRDFDFLVGDWEVAHRRLKERLARSTEWETFGGTCSLRPILGGIGNFDENVIELPAGTYRASTLRLFDVARERWSIYWLDARNAGRIEPPVHGRFEKGLGLFFGDDTLRGMPMRVRFLWTVQSPGLCRWEQAFSNDGEKNWETNWTMTFTRA